MRHIYILILICFSIHFNIKSMNFLTKIKETINHAIRQFHINHNENYKNLYMICDSMRVVPFNTLKEKYIKNNIKEISDEDINNLKKSLIKKNKLTVARIEDISSCIYNYNCIYKKHKNECNNIYFLDTILPLLFEGHDFSQKKDLHNSSYAMFPDTLFISGCENPYLVSSLAYIYGIPFDKMATNEPIIPFLFKRIKDSFFIYQESSKLGNFPENQVTYIKAILAPPIGLIQQKKNDIKDRFKALLLCLNRCKKKSAVYKIPKVILYHCILKHIINNTISLDLHIRYQKIRFNAYEQIEDMKKKLLKSHNVNDNEMLLKFLTNEFHTWANNNMDITRMVIQDTLLKK